MSKIVLTGASGFVGKHLVHMIRSRYRNIEALAVNRTYSYLGITESIVPDFFAHQWKNELHNAHTLIHLAALAHSRSFTDTYVKKINEELPILLFKKCVEYGVKNFIFLSTIKVFGEESDHAYTQDISPDPVDIYGATKYSAELRLQELSRASNVRLTIIRTPLVFGENAKANFLSLLKLCSLPNFIPLPFADIKNKRSVVYVKNLCSLIMDAHFNHMNNQINIIHAEGDLVSTTQLISDLDESLGNKRKYFRLPLILTPFMPKGVKRKLYGSLMLKNSYTFQGCQSKQLYSYKEAIANTTSWFKGNQRCSKVSSKKRFFDLFLCLIFSVPILLLTTIVALLVLLIDGRPMIYWSERVGRHNKVFMMPKFRTMKNGTPKLATHLLNRSSENYVTKLGAVLRKLSLDELPQFWSIIRGEMTLVGPRPALFNQFDLVDMRTVKGIPDTLPGVTGWAQINGRDSISLEDKVKFETEYKDKMSVRFDLEIIAKTVVQVLKRKNVSH